MKNNTLSCVTLGNVNLKYNEYRLQREIKRCPQHLVVPEISALKSILMIHIYYDKSLGTSVNGFINPT